MLASIMMHEKLRAVNCKRMHDFRQKAGAIADMVCIFEYIRRALCNMSIFEGKYLANLDIALLAISAKSQYS